MIAFNHACVNNFMWTGIDQSESPVCKSATQAQPSQQLQFNHVLRREIFSFHKSRKLLLQKPISTIVLVGAQKLDPLSHTCYFFLKMAILGKYT